MLAARQAGSPLRDLTPRELEIVRLAANCLTIEDIAHQLGVSPATVSAHLSRVYIKLDVHCRVAAVARALRLRLID
jgi:DNA-binding NarL/FixJ family response regulator